MSRASKKEAEMTLPQYIFKEFQNYYKRKEFHVGRNTEGLRKIWDVLARNMLFNRKKGSFNLVSLYTTPSWPRILKAIKGSGASFWRELWLEEDESDAKRGFYKAGIPDKVARNVTPGKEPEEYYPTPLIRLNRSQREDGKQASNLYQFDPGFLEYLATRRAIPVHLVEELIDWVNIQQANLMDRPAKEQEKKQNEELQETVEMGKDEALQLISESTEEELVVWLNPPESVQASDEERETVEETLEQELGEETDSEKTETAEEVTSCGKREEELSTVRTKVQTTYSVCIKRSLSDIKYLGENSLPDVDKLSYPDSSFKGKNNISEKTFPAKLEPPLQNNRSTQNKDFSFEDTPLFQRNLQMLEQIAGLKQKETFTQNNYPQSHLSNRNTIPQNSISWLEKLQCPALAKVCKQYNQQLHNKESPEFTDMSKNNEPPPQEKKNE